MMPLIILSGHAMRQLKTLLADLTLTACATILALALRDNLDLSLERLELILPYLLLSLIAAVVILPAMGMTRTLWRFSGQSDYSKLFLSCALIVLVSVSAGFALFRLDGVMRSLPILQLILMVILLASWRLGARARRFRHHRRNSATEKAVAIETVLVVGLNSISELYLQAMSDHAAGGVEIAGVLGRTERQTGTRVRSHKVLGTPEDIADIVRQLEVHGVSINRIVVAQPFEQLSKAARDAILQLEKGSQIEVDFLAERLRFTSRRRLLATQSSSPVQIEAPVSPQEPDRLAEALKRPYWRVKRILDAICAAMAIVVLAPLMLLIGILTAVSVGLPVVFWQKRPGRMGHPFKLFKFRTLLGAHDADGNRLPDELRETHLGRIMRVSRMDELPQLFNILVGHMSFVGPRPLLLVDQPEGFRDRLAVRPGLTGWAQANGGKRVSATDKMALDHWYILNASFLLDCRILFMTARMILFGEKTNPTAVERAWLEIDQHAMTPRR